MRLKRFSARLANGQVEGVTIVKDKISITPVRADEPKQAQALAEKIGALMPRVRITELLHEVARDTRFTSAFTNLRTQDLHDNENALLAVILADGSNLGLQEIGRVERTLFMLDWLESPALRRRCQAGLNESEQRHQLTGAICTFKQGGIADRTYEAQQFRASGLNLVIAAIVFWNSTYIADAVARLRSIGEDVQDEMLAHTSPVGWNHIAFSGDFLWERAANIGDGRRALKLPESRMAA